MKKYIFIITCIIITSCTDQTSDSSKSLKEQKRNSNLTQDSIENNKFAKVFCKEFFNIPDTINNNQTSDSSKSLKEQKRNSDLTQDNVIEINDNDFYRGKFYKSDTSYIYSILKKVYKIKEVHEFSRLHKDTIVYYISEKPSPKFNYYRVQVGLESYDHFSTVFNFFIQKDTHVIKILEVVTDSIMSIDDWRKSIYYH